MSRESSPPEKGTEKAANEAETLDESPKPGGKRTRQIVTGAAIGVGSAALVAALLYANRGRKNGGKS